MKKLEFEGQLEAFLAATCLALFSINVYFFLIAPQSWGLMDSYAYVQSYGGGHFSFTHEFMALVKGLMDLGRFRPMDSFAQMLRFKILPANPAAFHAFQILLLLLSIGGLTAFVRRLGFSSQQTWLTVLLFLGNLTIKDWIVYNTASESVAIMFYLFALALYVSEKRWWGVLLFVLSFLTKESFAVLALPFLVIEFLWFRPKKKSSYVPLAALCIITMVFMIFVKSLPRVYTAGHFTHLAILDLARALIVPPLKSFAPFILLVGWLAYFQRKDLFDSKQVVGALCGISIIIVYTALLVGWAPFSSWVYLHMPIPVGWCLLAGWVFPKNFRTNKVTALIVGLCCAYLALAAANGDNNRTSDFDNSKLVARLACQDAEVIPNLKIYTNCAEGADQLTIFLKTDLFCKTPVKIQYLGRVPGLPDSIVPPYELVMNKNCDAIYANPTAGASALPVNLWTVFRKLK